MKKQFLNIAVYVLLGWSMLSAGYLALPVEYQEMLPQMNWLTAVVSGGSTLVLGTGGLALQRILSKTSQDYTTKYIELGQEFLNLKSEYDKLGDKVNELQSTNKDLFKLLKVDLEAKLDNPMLTDKARALIEGAIHKEGVLNEKKDTV